MQRRCKILKLRWSRDMSLLQISFFFFLGFVTLEMQNEGSCLGLYSIFLLSFEPISVKIAARPVQML